MTIEFIPARKMPPPEVPPEIPPEIPPELPAEIQPLPFDGTHVDAIGTFSPHPILVLVGYLMLINAFTWLQFWVDKRRAIRNQWRIPESTLLLLAFLGGTIGAYGARQVFRHKTRKQPFSAQLHVIAIFQVVVLIAVLWVVLSGYSGPV